jgi:predicted P-loop ATPase
MWLTRNYDFAPSSALVAEAVEVLGRANAWHPVRTYLRSLQWDGEKRLTTWLAKYLGVRHTPYSARVGCWWMMGAVKRVLQPGAKFDYCMVLSGMQGKGKSTVFEILGGEWYGDTDLDLQSKDAMSALRGKLIYEIAEMGALARSEERRQKSFLSRRVDEYRPVYGRREIKAPRQVVFGGTTNEHEWQKDPTGGRRFWPVECEFDTVDQAGLREVRDQLFAEALARVEAGERYWPTFDEQRQLFDHEQLKVEQQDSLVDALHDWVYGRVKEFSAYDAAADGLKLDASKLTRDLQTRIGIALKKLGCSRVERRNGMIRYWYKPPVRNEAESTSFAPSHQPTEVEDVAL